MPNEMQIMDYFDVYEEVDANSLTQQQLAEVIGTRFVNVWKGNEVKARLVAQGFSQKATKEETYASTPLLLALKVLLLEGLSKGYKFIFGDVLTAFYMPNYLMIRQFSYDHQRNTTLELIYFGS